MSEKMNLINNYLPDLYDHSILQILYSPEEFEAAIEHFDVRSYKSGQIIAREGDVPDGLLIPLTGIIEIFSKNFEELLTSGTIQPFRSVNTYVALRQRPLNYSIRFEADGDLLVIPQNELQRILRMKPDAAIYLSLVTENIEIRSLAKALDSLGCSLAFKIAFVSKFDFHNFEPQTWLLQSQEKVQRAYYFFEGQVINQQKLGDSGRLVQWPVPCRKWSLWNETLSQVALTSVYKTTARTTGISVSAENLLSLRNDFSEDFEKLQESLNQGISAESSQSEIAQDFDIEKFLNVSKAINRSRFKTWPWVAQADEMDCGPACLAMVSQYYGKNTTLQFWRNILSTNKNGTSLFDLALIAEKNGYTASALQVESVEELDPLLLPFIILRQDHYLVVYDIKPGKIIVGDSRSGIATLSLEEFNDGFEQAVLVLKPNEEFSSLPERRFKYGHFFTLLMDFKLELSLSFFISFMMIILGLGTPLLTQIFLDDVLVRRDLNMMWLAFSGGLMLAVVKSFMGWSKTYYQNYLATKLDYKLSSLFLKKIISLPYSYFVDRHVGDMVTRFQELEKLKFFLLHSSENVILSFLSLVIYGLILFVYSPTVALTVFGSMPILMLFTWFTGRKLSVIGQEMFRNNTEVTSSLTDTFKGIAVIKSLGGELATRWRYQEKLIQLLKSERAFEIKAKSFDVVVTFYIEIIKYLAMGVSVYMAINGQLSPGQVIAITLLTGQVFGPLLQISKEFGEIQQVFSIFDRLNDVFFTQSEDSKKRGQVKKSKLQGEIEFRDVWFRYGGEGADWVLKGLNFKIEAGAKLAIVGPSGSGKSTIVGLLTRMYEPTKGQIFIDGRDYLDYDVNWLREKVGILYQESQLFNGSIAENIAFSDPEINQNRVTEVCQQANAQAFVESKPMAYDYRLSHAGMGLSGGEKQRVALARTFYKQPDVLVLDEATSALDGEAESELLNTLNKTTQNKTVINIAHRYSTVLSSDLVFVLAQGKLVGFGSHYDLERNNEMYQKLFPESQGDLAA